MSVYEREERETGWGKETTEKELIILSPCIPNSGRYTHKKTTMDHTIHTRTQEHAPQCALFSSFTRKNGIIKSLKDAFQYTNYMTVWGLCWISIQVILKSGLHDVCVVRRGNIIIVLGYF